MQIKCLYLFLLVEEGIKLIKINVFASKIRWEDMGLRHSGAVNIFNIQHNIDTRNTIYWLGPRWSRVVRTGFPFGLENFKFVALFLSVWKPLCIKRLSLSSFTLCSSQEGFGTWDITHLSKMLMDTTEAEEGIYEEGADVHEGFLHARCFTYIFH